MTISAAWHWPGRSHRPSPGRRPMISGCAALALSAGLVLASGLGPAAASTATNELYVAGYHFTAPRGSLTVHGSITVPRVSCGSGAHQLVPEVFVRYYAGRSLTVASVSLALTCDFGVPIYGDASLAVDNHTKVVPHTLGPGQTVGVNITIGSSRATAQISYSNGSSASLSEPGGRPYDARFSATVLNPPSFSPITFAGCTVDHKQLAAVRPSAWVAVDTHGHVLARPSGLRGGTTFTITP